MGPPLGFEKEIPPEYIDENTDETGVVNILAAQASYEERHI